MENTTNTPVQDITIADLDLLRQVVDLASTRGAFKGAELTQVGAVYDKLSRFLEAAIAQAQAQQEAATAEANSATPPQGE